MTTETLALTDFLLARIAEDEEMAQLADPADWAPGAGGLYWARGPGGEVCVARARVLAECEAKRQIVDLFPSSPDGDGWNEAGARVLALLALPYADHPDYRDEWRP